MNLTANDLGTLITLSAAAALRDELRCLDVGRTSRRAVADSRCARAYLLRLQFRLRYLPDAVKATPGYADVGASAICRVHGRVRQ